jgi:hypothetical protein
MNDQVEDKMNTAASPVAITLLLLAVGIQLVTPAAAGEQIAAPITASGRKESVTVDCSKEVWPDFSPSCLRNANATVIRLVTVNRRQ